MPELLQQSIEQTLLRNDPRLKVASTAADTSIDFTITDLAVSPGVETRTRQEYRKTGEMTVTDPETGVTFPNLNNSGGEATQTNLILPEPCEFIPGLPKCSVVRPTIDSLAGARAAVRALTADGLFDGQSAAFFRHLRRMAHEADAAERGIA